MKIISLILCFTLTGCAGYAHWTDYQQGKELEKIKQRLDALEEK